MSRKQLEPFYRHKAGKKDTLRKPTEPKQFDRRATGMPNGVVPGDDIVDCPSGDGTKLQVMRNLRGDVLAQMRKSDEINEHQFRAGRHWEGLMKRAEIGGIKAMDTSKDPVDGGGGSYEPLTDTQRMAVREMRRVERALGGRGTVLINLVLGRGWSITVIAEQMGSGTTTKREKLFYGRMFRDCLDVLAVEFGYATRKLLDQHESNLTGVT